MRLFREQVSEFVDRPRIKFGIGLFFLAVIAATFVGAVFAKNAAKNDFCLLHNCTNTSTDVEGNQVALGVSMGVILLGAAVVSAMALLIVCCFSETTESNEEVQESTDSDLSM